MTLTLERLSPASVQELVGHAVPGAGMLGTRLSDETEGLPLFSDGVSDGCGERRAGPRRRGLAAQLGVQDLLRPVSLRSVRQRAGARRRGRGRAVVRLHTVRAASGRGEEETLVALEELTSRGLIREVGSPVGGAPATTSTTTSCEPWSTRRPAWPASASHRRAAAALAGVARGRETDALAGQIARHHRLAGQDEEAARYYGSAGDYARSLHANSDASPTRREALGSRISRRKRAARGDRRSEDPRR